MILHYIPDDAVAVKVPSSASDINVFLEGDTHDGHIVCMEKPAQLSVGEAQGEDIQHHVLGQVMVNAVDLRLIEVLGQLPGQFLGGRQVVAKRLLHNDSHVAVFRPALLANFLHRFLKKKGRQRQIEDAVVHQPICIGLQLLVELPHGLHFLVVHGNELQVLGEVPEIAGFAALLFQVCLQSVLQQGLRIAYVAVVARVVACHH
mmetsp:Transcript_83268/g.199841  ORF Transcript_83268/g.199841 Transcript_83268/m.199841 type:complete len:204 (-) Transcript_83268:300-911(-)